MNLHEDQLTGRRGAHQQSGDQSALFDEPRTCHRGGEHAGHKAHADTADDAPAFSVWTERVGYDHDWWAFSDLHEAIR